MLYRVCLLAFLLLSSPAWATTYYVSQADGNDTYTGTERAHTTASTGPWKTLARVNAGPFGPGDSVLLKRGETWRELLTVPNSGISGNPITFGAYGTGSRPTVNGADLVTAWAIISSSVYRATVATRPVAVWFDGSIGTGRLSAGALSADGDWYWSSNELYIFSSTLPSAKVVESSSRGTVYMSDKSWITLEQLTFTKGGNAPRDGKSIAIRQSANIVLQDCDVTDSVNIGVDFFAVNGPAGDATIERCAFARTGMSKDPGGAHSAIQTYNTTDDPTFIFQHNTFQDIDPYGASLGHGIYAQSGKIIWRYNYHKGDSGPVRAGAAVRLANTGGSQVYGNIFSNEGGRRRWGILATAGVHHVFNNVFYENNYGILTDTGNPTIVAQNNIWFGSSSDMWFYVSIQAGTYRGDNNIFFGATNGWLYGDVLRASLAQWQAWSGQDARSLNTDPLFVSASDFRVQPSSPAIDAGVDVGLTEDFAGMPVPQGLAPDIGAYEWVHVTGLLGLPVNVTGEPGGLVTLPRCDNSLAAYCSEKPEVGTAVTRNTATGQAVIWLMDLATVVSQTPLPTANDSNWQIVAAADFNGDGHLDLVWRHAISGQNVVWFMSGTTLLSQALLPMVADANWQIVMAGDINGDGRPGLVWRNVATLQNVVWHLNGTTFLSKAPLPSVPDPNRTMPKNRR